MRFVPRDVASMDDVRAVGRVVGEGDWLVKVWPTCGEASVTLAAPRARSLGPDDPGFAYWEAEKERRRRERVEGGENEERAVRRARGEVRRYSRHNRCYQMVTFTFAGDVPEFDSLGACVNNFWRRWERATGRKRGPYVWVPEWGKVSGRLHIHMAVPWWYELDCTEVCAECDRYNVLEDFGRGRRVHSLCVGCLWGLGFVGRPRDRESQEVETNEDGRALSRYLTKYMTKDLGSELGRGQQRYRAAEGYQAACVDEMVGSPDEGVSFAMSVVSGTFAAGEAEPIIVVM